MLFKKQGKVDEWGKYVEKNGIYAIYSNIIIINQ